MKKTTEKTKAASDEPTFQPKPPTPTKRALRHEFSEQENLENAKQLAEALNESDRCGRDLDRVKADYKSRQTVIDSKIGQLREKVISGYEIVDTACEWRYDNPAPGRKSLWRLDTEEIVETCDMTDADKQVELPLSDRPFGVPVAEAFGKSQVPAVSAKTSRSGVVAVESDGDDISDPEDNETGN